MTDDLDQQSEDTAFKHEISQLLQAYEGLSWRQRAEALRWYADLAWTRSETDPAPATDETVITQDGDTEDPHLEGVDDGCGCVEMWEHLSDQRASD